MNLILQKNRVLALVALFILAALILAVLVVSHMPAITSYAFSKLPDALYPGH